MKTTILLLAALALAGCANVPKTLISHVPKGTWKSVDFTTTVSGYGSANVHMTDVVCDGTNIEAGSYNATLSSPFQPIVTISATGFTPAPIAQARAREAAAAAPPAPKPTPAALDAPIELPRDLRAPPASNALTISPDDLIGPMPDGSYASKYPILN